MALDAAALAVGRAVGERAARVWLGARSGKESRSKDLVELMRAHFADQLVRRKAERQIEDIADSVTARVLKVCAHEYPGLTDDDRGVVLAEVVGTLSRADLSDRALFAAAADPVRLARDVRAALPASQDLPEAAARLYEVVLDECCDCLVRIVLHLPEFQPRAAADTLARLAKVGDDISVMLERLPARTLEAPDGTDRDTAFTRRYLEHVSRTLDTLDLIGVRVERFTPRTSLSVAYISLSVSATRTRPREPAAEPWHEPVGAPSAMRVESALAQGRRMLLRGEAGGGKSTLLRWLAITAARGGFTGPLTGWNGCVPFLIKLRGYADRALPRPEQFLDGAADPLAGLMPAGWVHRRLSSGQALLLVDGVDELTGTQRQAIKPWLRGLLAEFGATKVVVTSRPSAARSTWLDGEGFAPAFLERMTPSDTRALVEHWHAAVKSGDDLPCPPELLPVIESRLLRHLENTPSLRSLAATPLLASMLCALNLDRAAQLPPSRMGLYAAALDMLLERRDRERAIPSYGEFRLDRAQKLQILQLLAWELSMGNRVELPFRAAAAKVARLVAGMPLVSASGEEVLRYLLDRSGVIREPADGRIDFVHRTVQEYLTARAAAEDGDLEPLIAAAHRDTWRETVIMAAGHANAPLRRELLEGLLRRIHQEPRHRRRLKLLVAACFETLPHVPDDLRPGVNACLDDLVPPRDAATARSLATGGEAVLNRLPTTLAGLSDEAAKATVRTAWLINGPKALEVLVRYARDEGAEIQDELNEAWSYFDPDDYAKRVLSQTTFVGPLRVDTPGQFRALRHVPPSRSLRVRNFDLDDLNPLLHWRASLRRLNLSRVTLPDDLTPLSSLTTLTNLAIGAVGIPGLSFLAGLPQLAYLYLIELTRVEDYRPLRRLSRLRSLSLYGATRLTRWDDLPPLDRLFRLTLDGTPVVTRLAEVIERAPSVRELRLSDLPLPPDLDRLPELPLTHLNLRGMRDLTNLAPLAGLSGLRELWIPGIAPGTDLEPLAELPSLETVHVSADADHPNAALLGTRVKVVDY
ncbi:NACHT domain-containing protein [Nonomuraea sp. NPDC049421]|uniref:NACHT domain-containing protein n=1 Tax=Nonomuraea sp. NPDC049421 TaxID=3155275 RepID=UPI00344366C0